MKREARLSLLVIAPWGPDSGFRLGGAAVKSVSGGDSLNAEINVAVTGGEVGVLAVPERMKAMVSEKNRKLLSRGLFPMVVYYPFPEKWEAPLETGKEMDEIVRRAIGYRLRIKLR